MMPAGRLRGRCLASIAISAVAVFAGASEGFRAPRRNVLLQPGDSTEISWTMPARFSAGEMELVLSLDGGKSFPIRVTRDLSPSTTTVLWRVPALATPRARLGLRTGDGEEPDREFILFLSEEFAILPDPSAGLEPVVRERGEWRTAEACASADSSPLPFSLEPDAATRALRRTSPAAEAAPPRVSCLTRPGPRFNANRATASDHTRVFRTEISSAGSITPLRL